MEISTTASINGIQLTENAMGLIKELVNLDNAQSEIKA